MGSGVWRGIRGDELVHGRRQLEDLLGQLQELAVLLVLLLHQLPLMVGDDLVDYVVKPNFRSLGKRFGRRWYSWPLRPLRPAK